MQLLAVALGETGADYLSVNLELSAFASAWIAGALFCVALIVQFRQTHYNPPVYWPTVAFAAIAGSVTTDFVHDGMTGTLIFCLFVTMLALWAALFRLEGSLAMGSITRIGSQAVYWMLIVTSYAWGAAANEMLTVYVTGSLLGTSLILCGVLALVVACVRRAGFNAARAFWPTFLVICPTAASLADALSYSVEKGGLGLGAVAPSLVLMAAIVAFLPYMTVTREAGKVRTIRFDFQ